MNSKWVWEVALTVLAAIFLLVAGGRNLLGGAGVSGGATGLDVGFSGCRSPAKPGPAGQDAPGALAAN
jgi:hypothetical protein